MTTTFDPPAAPQDVYRGFVPALLQVLGVFVMLLTPIALLVLLAWGAMGGAAIDALFVGLLLAGLAVGWTLGGLLLGLGTLLRHQQAGPVAAGGAMAESAAPEVDKPVTYTVDPEEVGSGATGWDPHTVARLMTGVSEMQELLSANPDERESVRNRLRTERLRRAGEAVVDAVNLRQIGRARELLAHARAVFGDTATFDRLAERIDEAAGRQEALDHARTRRLVEEAVKRGRWARAEQYAHTLWRDHPNVSRCRKLWEETRRARLYAHVQESAQHHHWIEAVAAAEEFLTRFPDSFEAETLHAQMGTLRSNSEIQQRKQYEQRFKDLVGSKHYLEALRLAQLVIAQYPDSPQAGALRQQIPILERRLGPTPPPAEARPVSGTS